MKKNKIILSAVCVAFVGLVILFNTEVTYQQGINYKVCAVKIPLYLKVLDFFDRHYNYKNLTRKIIKSSDNVLNGQ